MCGKFIGREGGDRCEILFVSEKGGISSHVQPEDGQN